MVVANSTWVRPADLVYMDSGVLRYFPPRNNGPIPRALTFDDWEGRKDCDPVNNNYDGLLMHQSYYNQDCHMSFTVAEDSSVKHEVDDPPAEYKSFEHEYLRQPVLKEADAFLEYEVPSMSTPTDQYTDLRRHKKLLAHQTHSLSSGATMDSPLMQTDSESRLSLDDLIDLYTNKMHQSRMGKGGQTANEQDIIRPSPSCSQPDDSNNDLQCATNSRKGNNEVVHHSMNQPDQSASHSQSSSPSTSSFLDSLMNHPATIRLRRIDVEILLEHIERMMMENSNSAEDPNISNSNQWACPRLTLENIESIIDACCGENVEFELME